MDREKLSVEDIFARLAEQMPSYEDRAQQVELALAIERSFQTGVPGLFEAGTGIGKSLSALIPAVISHKRVVISTNTISLQEQYLYKDIPTLQAVLPFPIEAAILKGRSNYIGVRRWEEQLIEQAIDERLIDWVNNTEYGDISELEFLPPYDLWTEINSDSDDCLRQRCPSFKNCFYFEARRKAEHADIIIVNHALLLAHAASQTGILPAHDLLIVDEAHHFPSVATDAFSVSISNRGVRALGSRALKKLSAPARLVHEMENESVQFFERLNEICLNIKTRVKQPLDGARSLIDALTNLRDWLNEQAFEHLLDVDMAREKAKLKANALISMINNYITCLNLVTDPDPNWVVWVEKGDGSGSRMQIVAAPLDVSSSISDLVLNQSGLQASVWMSATLASVGDDPFKYFKRAIGADNHVIQHRIPSPFDYQNQALLYLPKSLPEPNDPGFLNAAAEEIENILSISKGRAFILFTSRAALNAAYEMLSDRLPYQCRRQGDMSRQRLIEWFKNTPSAVLFGTASFWEGVSVDGDQLSAVIIDRIPFQAPDDPVYEARCDALKDDPEASWFNDLALPHATMRLKQGVGRLIRTHRDRGLVAVLDRRLTTKQYGARILECLPPMTIIRSLNGIDSLEDRFDYSGDSGLTRQSEIGEWSTR